MGDMLLRKALFPLCFSPLAQESFLRTALGLSGRPSASDPRRKSVSVERTFTPTSDFAILREEHLEICRMLAEDVRKIGIVGARTITLKLKLASFDVLTRSLTPSEVITSPEDTQKYSLELLEKEKGQEIRLLGVRLSHLVFEEEKKSKTVRILLVERNCLFFQIADFWNDRKLKPIDDDDDDDVIMETRPCPICGADVENQLDSMNRHVDSCLQKIQGEEAPELICISVSKPPSGSKKRKFAEKSKNSKNIAKKMVTIDSFWKKK